jgi:hypothetical protein
VIELPESKKPGLTTRSHALKKVETIHPIELIGLGAVPWPTLPIPSMEVSPRVNVSRVIW